MTNESGKIRNRYGVWDAGVGLYRYNARCDNPQAGRFLTQDTYQGNPWQPWTQNLYTYVGNNPVNYVDPTGHNALAVMQRAWSTAKYRAMGVISAGVGLLALSSLLMFEPSSVHSDSVPDSILKDINDTSRGITNQIKDKLYADRVELAAKEWVCGCGTVGPDGKMYRHWDDVNKALKGLRDKISHLKDILTGKYADELSDEVKKQAQTTVDGAEYWADIVQGVVDEANEAKDRERIEEEVNPNFNPCD